MTFFDADSYWLARWLFDKALAALYLLAFLVARNQFPALLGEDGLLPAPRFLARARFREAPSVFHWRYSDRMLRGVCWLGMALALATIVGLVDHAPIWAHALVWLTLWGLYLSIVNIGQTFYGFGWESMLLEAGFFAAFLGPAWVMPSWIPLWALYWMLLRVEVGAGLIKLRGDACWRDLTALYYHHETQPMPNPLSHLFHGLPRWSLRAGVVFSHGVQVGAPFLLFAPQPVAAVGAALIIAHQLLLIVAGNYAWLNWLTVVLALLAFSNPHLGWIPGLPAMPPDLAARPPWFEGVLLGLLLLTAWLSVQPLKNLFSDHQRMNYCWNRWHLVCAYGAFGSVTLERYEVVVEGTLDAAPGPDTEWREYGFRAKPTELDRRPPQFAPYHLRLDWLMWFLPFSVRVFGDRMLIRGQEYWFVRFVEKLLAGDGATLKLLRRNPFPDRPPRLIRARYYRYQFTDSRERKATGRYWRRELIGDYLPPVSLD